ncbi:hypothetical protein [Brevibacterium album]|uniref:hypothetical protein n=1 Tax=Brevibacterium album TaxID=417948 RepID=UPI00040D47FD|nr:hypothetical protein [Brevibacterium album]
MGKHSDSRQSWAGTARDFASAVVTWKRKPQGRYSSGRDGEQLTATGVLSTVRRRPMVAAIALPAAATAGIVASTLAMGPDTAGTVTAEAAQTSSASPEAEETTASAEELEAQQEKEYEEYVSSLKEDERYQAEGGSSMEKVPEPKPSVSGPARSQAASGEGGADSDSGSGGGGVSNAPCSVSSSIESGLTANGVAAYRAVCANFSEVSSYGGRRNDPGSDHNSGRAVDIMITGSTGDQIRDFLIAHKDELNVDYVIWEQKIYASYTGWSGRAMEDRGSVTANHYDHVHVSVK